MRDAHRSFHPGEDLATAIDLLLALVGFENDACRYDHDGYCQTHNKGEGGGVCVVAEAREWLGIPPGGVA